MNGYTTHAARLAANPLWKVAFCSSIVAMSLADARAQTVAAPPAAAPASSNAAADAESAVAPIQLNPFQVSADQDVGYLANNTLSGSRLNTSLKDTASSISVFDPAFIADLGAFSLKDVMVYGVNTVQDIDEGSGGGANGNALEGNYQLFRVRGQDISLARNYFNGSNLPVDLYNVDRIDESRGPNSVLFGVGSPSGVINVSTKKAVIGKDFDALQLSYGSYDSRRAALDVNASLLNNTLAIRLNVVDYDESGYRYFTEAAGRFGTISATYRPTPKIEIRAELEAGTLHDNIPRSWGFIENLNPWLFAGKPIYGPNDPVPGDVGSRMPATGVNGETLVFTQNVGQSSGQLLNMNNMIVTNEPGSNLPLPGSPLPIDAGLATSRVNPQGPDGGRNMHMMTDTFFLDAELAKGMFFEAGFNHLATKHSVWNNSGASILYGDPNALLPGNLGANPYAGRVYTQDNWQSYNLFEREDRGRVAISYERDFGKWGNYRAAVDGELEHRTSGNVSEVEVYSGAPFNPTPDSYANYVFRRSYPIPGVWDTYYLRGPGGPEIPLLHNVTDPVTGRTFSSQMVPTSNSNDVIQTQEGIMAAGQASYFNDRLVIGGGVRRDYLKDFARGLKRDPSTDLLETDPTTGTAQSVGGNTSSFGVVAHVLKGYFDLIYNQSDNFTLPAANNYTLTGAYPPSGAVLYKQLPPPKGVGREEGFAITLIDNKLYLKAVHFTSNAVNQADYNGYNEVAPTAVRINDALLGAHLITQADYNARDVSQADEYLYDEVDKGYEITLTANFTKNWRLWAAWSVNEPAQSNTEPADIAFWKAAKAYYAQFPQTLTTLYGQTLAQEISNADQEIGIATSVDGIGEIGFRKYKWNFFTRYTFASGFLRNAYVGGGYIFQSQMLLNQVNVGHPNQYLQYGGKTGNGSAMVGYDFKLMKKYAVNIQVNAFNVFNQIAPIIIRRDIHATDPNGAKRVQFPDPRNFRLTTTIAF